MRPKIICIVGRTCSGKDSITRSAINNSILRISNYSKDLNCSPFKVLHSYTTRPMRKKETGDSHIFITMKEYEEIYKDKDKIAETVIDGNHYFVLKEQFNEVIESDSIPVYIIDPNGLEKLKKQKEFSGESDIYTVLITTSYNKRLDRYINRGSTKDNTIPVSEFISRNDSENRQFHRFEQDAMYKDNVADLILINNTATHFHLNVDILTTTFVNLYYSFTD